VTVITSAFGKELPAASGVSFATLTPLDSSGHRYRVAGVTPVSAPIPVAFGLAFGPLTNARLHPGETIDVRFALDPPVEDALAGIGGGPMLLRDGDWYEDPHAPAPDERDVRWPVIGLGRLADDSLLLAAVDGRHPERSVGMTRPEFADLLRDFHVVDAMALDSGGSVTMVSRAPGDATVTVRNVPSDSSSERWVSDGFFIYSSAPAPSLVPPRVAPTPVPEARPSP
ncbi:MAG TPA: phosphodiester glycosidase family protein, partial [Candidatus Baltobacteraceae bacterium]|nr:phosphodiester glycosidase family protein [Candidatus Baltobacteraceae bacterium]